MIGLTLGDHPFSRCNLPKRPIPTAWKHNRYIAGVSLCLLITLLLGAYLRWYLASVAPLFGSWGNLRNTHIHLGYYGVIFPMMWLSWRTAGATILGKYALWLYSISVVSASLGFLFTGYGIVAIIGSTGVLIIWLISAFNLQRWTGRSQSWLKGVPIAILLGALCIPAIAVTGGAERNQWLRTFLTLLLLGGAVPTACLLDGLRRPKGSGLWLAFTILAAIAVGPLDSSVLQLAFAGMGLILLFSTPKEFTPNAVMWQITGLSLIIIGVSELNHFISIAGTHYMLLGPVLIAMTRPAFKGEPSWLEWWYLGALLLFTAAMAVPAVLPSLPNSALITAGSGSAVVVTWIWKGFMTLSRQRNTQGSQS